MKQYKQSYKQENQKEQHKRSMEFVEYPQIQEYYSSQMSSGGKKPKRIIVTEIYDESAPQTAKNLKRKEYFNYYTESSLPYQNQQGFRSIEQKRLFNQNRNIYLTGNQEIYSNSNINNFYSDYYKKLYFGGTDLREEYSNPSNERVNIRKKVHRGSNTPQPVRYNYDLRGGENFIENFQYHESKNIRDKNNKKYQSITRFTGYSNIIPLNSRRMQNSLNGNFNSVNLSSYNYLNKELKHNYSNFGLYKTNALVQKLQSPEKFTKIEIQKTTKEIQKKPEIQKKTNLQIQTSERKYESIKVPQTTTKTNVQAEATKRKYESTKIPQTTTKATNVQVQKTQKKYESTKMPQTTPKSTNVQIQTTKRKYESSKPQTTTKTTNITNISTKKIEAKKQETTSKAASTQLKTDKKFHHKINIDMSKYNRDSNKLYFNTSHGKYKYKDSISDKDIIDSRKNNLSEAKNVKKVAIVENTIKKKEVKKIDNLGKTSITQANKSSSYKKSDKTFKNSVANNKTTVKTNISNLNKNNIDNSKVTKTTTEVKTTTNISKTNANSNNNNNIKEFKNSYKFTNKNIKTANTNNKRSQNVAANVSNITKKNIEISNKVVDTYNEGLNLNKYKKEYINTEIRRNDMSGKYLNNSKSVKKIFDNRNIGLIENKEMYEIREKRKERTPKMKIKKKLLGDNYKYYESKFMQNPNENTNINSYTLHQRRNERVIYGTEEIEVDKIDKVKSYKLKPEIGGYKIKKKKKIHKKRMMPANREQNNYVVYNKYYQDNYNYNGGQGEEKYEFDNEKNYEQEVIYYQ